MNLKGNHHLLLYYCAHLIQSQSKTSLYTNIIIILKSHPVLHICWENFCCIFRKLKNVRYCAPSDLEMQGCLFSFKSNHCWRRKEGNVLFKPHSTYCWAWRNVIVLSFLLNWATAEEMLWLFYLFFQSLLSASQMGDDILMFLSLILFQPLLHNWLKGTYLFSVSS